MSFELFEKLAERCPLLQEAGEGGSYKRRLSTFTFWGITIARKPGLTDWPNV